MLYVDRDENGELTSVMVPTPSEKDAATVLKTLPTDVATLQTQIEDLTSMITEMMGGTEGVNNTPAVSAIPKPVLEPKTVSQETKVASKPAKPKQNDKKEKPATDSKTESESDEPVVRTPVTTS